MLAQPGSGSPGSGPGPGSGPPPVKVSLHGTLSLTGSSYVTESQEALRGVVFSRVNLQQDLQQGHRNPRSFHHTSSFPPCFSMIFLHWCEMMMDKTHGG